ncbi:hypothetical protein FHG87_010153 [Trinorchestia longiramus]|nr:hypothetical protein FHG87_010153 [Trinorchestia longiramus]
MDLSSQSREGNHQQESIWVMPVHQPDVSPVTPCSAATPSPSGFLKGAVCSNCKEQASSCLFNDSASDANSANACGCPAEGQSNLTTDDTVTSEGCRYSLAGHFPDLKLSRTVRNDSVVISDDIRAAVNNPSFWDSDDDFQQISDPEASLSNTDAKEALQRQSSGLSELDTKEDNMSQSAEISETTKPRLSEVGTEQTRERILKQENILGNPGTYELGSSETCEDESDCETLVASANEVNSVVGLSDDEPGSDSEREADTICWSSDAGSESDDYDDFSKNINPQKRTETRGFMIDKGINHDDGDTDSDSSCGDEDPTDDLRNSSDGDDDSNSDSSSSSEEDSDVDDDRDEIEFENSDSDDGIEFSSDSQFAPGDGEDQDESDSDDSIQFLTADEIDSDDDLGLDMDSASLGRASPASPGSAGMSSGYSSSSDGLDSTEEDAEAEASRFCVLEANRKWNTHYWQAFEECNSAEVVFEPQPKPIVHKPTLNSLPSKSLMKKSRPSLASDLLSCFQETSVACFTSTVVRTDQGSVEEYSSSSYSITLKEINTLEPSSSALSEHFNSTAINYSDMLNSASSISETATRSVGSRAHESNDCNTTQCTVDASLNTTRPDAQVSGSNEEKRSLGDEAKRSMEVLVNLFPTGVSDLQREGDSISLALKEKEAIDLHAEFETRGKSDADTNITNYSALISSIDCKPVQLVMDVACPDVESCVNEDGVDYEDVCYNGVVESFDVVRKKNGVVDLRASLSYKMVPFNLFSSPARDQFRDFSSVVCKKSSPRESVEVDQDKKDQGEKKALVARSEYEATKRHRRVIFNLVIGVRCLHAFMAEHQEARNGRCWMQCAMDRARERRAAGKPETGDDSDDEE